MLLVDELPIVAGNRSDRELQRIGCLAIQFHFAEKHDEFMEQIYVEASSHAQIAILLIIILIFIFRRSDHDLRAFMGGMGSL